MELIDCLSAREWDKFIASASQAGGAEFSQSWAWGELLQAEGEEVRRLGLLSSESENGELLLLATLVKKKITSSYYHWFCPRGPIFSRELESGSQSEKNAVLNFFARELVRLDKHCLFLRIEPLALPLEPDKEAVRDDEFLFKKTLNLSPAETLILDLAQSEEKLLAAMHPKTRYNIRLAEKKGVQIQEARPGDKKEMAEFWRLLNLTGARDGFRLHTQRHYENLLNFKGGQPSREGRTGRAENVQSPDFQIRLLFAIYQEKKITAGLFAFWGDKATYLHGASDNEFRHLMAPQLLQWRAIQRARQENYKYYDFYGLDEEKWPGVTRFKLGFGGRRLKLAGTWDLVFRPELYNFYQGLRKIRRALGRLGF